MSQELSLLEPGAALGAEPGEDVAVSVEVGATTVAITPFMSRTGYRDHVYAVFAIVRDAEGREGFGHALFMSREAAVEAATAAIQLVGRREDRAGLTLAGLLQVESREDALPERSWATRAAACALSLAAWDLLGRRCGLPCAVLWGGKTEPTPCYSSFHLAFAPDEGLEEAARGCLADGFLRAKMVVGSRPIEEDLARVARVQAVLGSGNVAVDALWRWTPEIANSFADRAELLMWIEDPAPYAQLSELNGRHPIAVGESSSSLAELRGLLDAGATHMLIDLGLVGGPARQLAASRSLAAAGARIGFHAYPYYSVHLAGCFESPLPVEVLDWGDALFRATPRPDSAGLLAVSGPGFGVEADHDFLSAHAYFHI